MISMTASKDDLRILLTGWGAPGTSGTIHMLQQGANSEGVPLTIFGVDTMDSSPKIKGLAEVFKVPEPSDVYYLESLNEIIESRGVSLVIPQTTRESQKLSYCSNKINAAVAVMPGEKFRVLNDKLLLSNSFREAMLPTPDFFEVSSLTSLATAAHKLGYPEKDIVVKLPSSSGMRGVRKISAKRETYSEFANLKPNSWSMSLERLIEILEQEEFPRLMVMEYLNGDEITIDVLARNGRKLIIPRSRNIIRSGISMDADLVMSSSAVNSIDKIIDHLELEGLFGFQMISDGKKFKILECNPRVQGTMVASLLSGVNILWTEVKWHLGLQIEESDFDVLHRVGNFRRSWAEL